MAPSQRDGPRKERRTRHRRDESHDDLLAPRTRESPRRSARRSQHAASRSETSKTSSNPLSEDSLARLNAVNEKLGWNVYDSVDHAAQERIRVTQEGLRVVREHRGSGERVAKRERRRRRDDGDYRERGEERRRHRERDRSRESDRQFYREKEDGDRENERRRDKRRVVSGPLLEEGKSSIFERYTRNRGGAATEDEDDRLRQKRRRLCEFFNDVRLFGH